MLRFIPSNSWLKLGCIEHCWGIFQLLFLKQLERFGAEFLLNIWYQVNSMMVHMRDFLSILLLLRVRLLFLVVIQLSSAIFHIIFYFRCIFQILDLSARFLLPFRDCRLQCKVLPKAFKGNIPNQYQLKILFSILATRNLLFLHLILSVICWFYPFLVLTSPRNQWLIVDFFRF